MNFIFDMDGVLIDSNSAHLASWKKIAAEDGVETEADSEAEEGIEVEITEADPETGEDVTDLEVEIVEEETDDADA